MTTSPWEEEGGWYWSWNVLQWHVLNIQYSRVESSRPELESLQPAVVSLSWWVDAAARVSFLWAGLGCAARDQAEY